MSAQRYALLFVVALSACQAIAVEPEAVAIGESRELFVDHYLIERLEGARLELHHPQPAEVAMRFDRPWEGTYSQYVTIIKDGEKYLMYYRGLPGLKDECTDRECTCLAESADGIHWTRPNLGLYTVHGTLENNVVLFGQTPASHNFSPFIDTKPGVPASERFKAVAGVGGYGGLMGFASADGLRWTKLREEPIVTEGAFDSQNLAFWSESEQCYVCYFRTYNGVRTISRATSSDFLTWTKPAITDFDGHLEEHLYTNQTHPYYRAPHIYVAFPMRFCLRSGLSDAMFAQIAPNLDPLYTREAREECSDSVFMTSRGGNRYDRTFREAFFRPGLDPGNWVSRTVMAGWGVVPTGPNEMSIYYGQHDGQKTAHLLRCTLRIDGFASINAPFEGGELLTKPLQFSGNELEINYSTSAAGSIRVEVQNAAGEPIPGFTLDECPEIIGDQIERVVTWKAGGDVGALRQPIRLRFVMKDADLYSLRFRVSGKGTQN
ncbi:MAG: hypothetical protein WC655_29905 [Candidatus Hydrogenedentales bacterium]|jgi:hypothetical protein